MPRPRGAATEAQSRRATTQAGPSSLPRWRSLIRRRGPFVGGRIRRRLLCCERAHAITKMEDAPIVQAACWV
eukprot:414327-Prymnesium_polylepis.1